MSIFAVLENNIKKSIEERPEIFNNFNNPDAKAGMAFMIYSLENIFKGVSFNDIEEGIVDSLYRNEKHDYGIDAIYLTANGEVINSIEELVDYNYDTRFVFHIYQFKKGRGIEQADLLKFKEGISKVFINEEELELNAYFSGRMLMLNSLKRKIFEEYLSNQVSVNINVVFGGIEENITGNQLLSAQLDDIIKHLKDSGYQFSKFAIFDIQKILNQAKNIEEIIGLIKYQKTLKYITEESDNNKLNGYVSVVKAMEIASLVKKWQGELFEANIRDYYKRNDLNSKIIDTSTSADEAKYFWSYNNGLTITCRKVEELPNDTYRLHGIQIVNGCQTSNALYYALANLEALNSLNEKRESIGFLTKKEEQQLEAIRDKVLNEQTTVLVKIVETNDSELIYRITETTNSQTPIKSFSLKANDDIQQHIEEYLLQYNIYYERRINFYKNKGKRPVVTIQQLFQLYMSQVFLKPSQAKGALKVSFTNMYETVFPATNKNSHHNYALYLIPILVDQKIDIYIRQVLKNPSLDKYAQAMLSYGRLHLGPLVLYSILGPYNQKKIVEKQDLIKDEINDEKSFKHHLLMAIVDLDKVLRSVVGHRPQSIVTGIRLAKVDDQIAKLVNTKKPVNSSVEL